MGEIFDLKILHVQTIACDVLNRYNIKSSAKLSEYIKKFYRFYSKDMYCPFCDQKVIEVQTIYESENVRVIYNIRPANKGQCVVVPKRHVTNIRELTRNELIDLISAVQLVSQKYNEYLNPIGLNSGFNEGSYAGQMVEHFHFHIMPRTEGDKDRLPEYHLFHRDPKTKKDLSIDELGPFIDEMKNLFK